MKKPGDIFPGFFYLSLPFSNLIANKEIPTTTNSVSNGRNAVQSVVGFWSLAKTGILNRINIPKFIFFIRNGFGIIFL